MTQAFAGNNFPEGQLTHDKYNNLRGEVEKRSDGGHRETNDVRLEEEGLIPTSIPTRGNRLNRVVSAARGLLVAGGATQVPP
jgi:hypothetical protein